MKNNKILAVSLLASLMLVGCNNTSSNSSDKDNSTSITTPSNDSHSSSSEIQDGADLPIDGDQSGGNNQPEVDVSTEAVEVNEANLKLFKDKYIDSSYSDEDYYDDISAVVNYDDVIKYDYTDSGAFDVPEDMKDKLDDKILELEKNEYSRVYTYEKLTDQLDLKINSKQYTYEELDSTKTKTMDVVFYKNDETNQDQEYINDNGSIEYYNVSEAHKGFDPDGYYIPYSPRTIGDALNNTYDTFGHSQVYLDYADDIDLLEYYFEDRMISIFDLYIPDSFEFIATNTLSKQNDLYIYEYDLTNNKPFDYEVYDSSISNSILMKTANLHMTIKYDGTKVTDFSVKHIFQGEGKGSNDKSVVVTSAVNLNLHFDRKTNSLYKVFDTKPNPVGLNVPDKINYGVNFDFITNKDTYFRNDIFTHFQLKESKDAKLGNPIDQNIIGKFSDLKHTQLIYNDKDITKEPLDIVYNSFETYYYINVLVDDGYAVVCHKDLTTGEFIFEEINVSEQNTYNLRDTGFDMVNNEPVYNQILNLKNKGFYFLEKSGN